MAGVSLHAEGEGGLESAAHCELHTLRCRVHFWRLWDWPYPPIPLHCQLGGLQGAGQTVFAASAW